MIGVLGLVVMGASLSACFGHDNPLKQSPSKQSAQFLVHASQYAEKKLNVYQEPGGAYYGACMDGHQKAAFCHKLYRDMTQFAQKTQNFKGLTTGDLRDKATWKLLHNAYQREQFNAI